MRVPVIGSQVLTSIYGCGPATADKWYKRGLRTVEDIKTCTELELTEMQKMGMIYVPVPRPSNFLVYQCPGHPTF